MSASLVRCIFYLLALAASTLAASAAGEGGVLTVQVAGLKHTRGLLHYALYAEGDVFPGRRAARFRDELPIDRLDFTFAIAGIAPGRYALIVAHDENGDGEIETPSLLRPFAGEPVGVSNYAGRLFSTPRFEKAQFALGGEGGAIAVTLFNTGIF